jgi:NADPH:quinone reductase-like Zn-dependent oxidoreductase
MMRKGVPLYARLFLGLMRPRRPIPGTGFTGVIDALGKEVRQFKVGDLVFGETGVNFGANAEYVCVSETGVLDKLPGNMTDEEAATLCDGPLTSLSFLKDVGKIQEGQKVLVNGAAGSLGSAAVQIARHFGAEVTGVCSTSNQEFVWSLGADKVIDYTETDFTQAEDDYDIIFDTVGKSSFSRCRSVLREDGAYLSPVLKISLLFHMVWTSRFERKKARFSATGLRPVEELRGLLKELVSLYKKGKLKTVIDRRYPLELATEAHRYVDTGHKRGNVVLTIASVHGV